MDVYGDVVDVDVVFDCVPCVPCVACVVVCVVGGGLIWYLL